MKTSLKEIAEIETELYLASRLKPDARLQRLSELTLRLKKCINTFDNRRKLHLAPVKQCLMVLDGILTSGHVTIMGVEDREVFQWIRKEVRYFLENWDNLT